MNLEINNKNYKNYIHKLKLNKKNDLLICMPTYNSFEITSQTINSFYEQEGTNFDLMVIGPSGDVEKLSERYPQINYCITKDNYGSSGNQLINIYVSINYKYELVMLSDNDALLLEKDGLYKLKENIINSNLLVTYPNNYRLDKITNDTFCPLHCTLYKVEVFKYLKPAFNFNYFLLFDDIVLRYKLRKYHKRIRGSDCNYYHPTKINSFYSYKSMFFYLRSYLIVLLYEDLSFKNKFEIFKTNFPIVFFLRMLIKFDLNILKIFLICIKQVINKKFELITIPKDPMEYREVKNPDNKEIYKPYNIVYSSIYNVQLVYLVEFDGIRRYYKLLKSKV